MAGTEKKAPPPYTTYKSFTNFINGLRDNGMPSHITRSMLPGSNSGKATMAASLKSLGLVDGNDVPSKKMKQLVDSDKDYSDVLRDILYDSYEFLTDADFDLENTTTDKVVEKFKEYGASGSTVTKCMAFFLSACQDAGIRVSSYVKAPTPVRNTPQKKKKKPKGTTQQENSSDGNDDDDLDFEGMIKIPVPLHGMDDGLILFPEGMNKQQWQYALNIATFLLQNYRPDYFEDGLNDEDGD